MIKNYIDILHERSVVNCPWGVYEDLVATKYGIRYPGHLLNIISSIGDFTVRLGSEIPAMVCFSDLRVVSLYDKIREVAGFSYVVHSFDVFDKAVDALQDCIDQGQVPMVATLDLYYLPYFKRAFHCMHVKGHHAGVVGYDRERRVFQIVDSVKSDIQSLHYQDLEKAWRESVRMEGEKTFAFVVFSLDRRPDIAEVLSVGLKDKAKRNLAWGIPRMRKYATEILKWADFYRERYLDCAAWFVEHTGFPPLLPKSLLDFVPPKDSVHQAGREVMAERLRLWSEEFKSKAWERAAEKFERSGWLIENMTREVTEVIIARGRIPNRVREMFLQIAQLEMEAYEEIER